MSINDYLRPAYEVAYYGGAVIVCLGLALVLIRTRCLPSELLQKRYNHYYHNEISAFTTYVCVLGFYVMNAFVLPVIGALISKYTEYQDVTGQEQALTQWSYFSQYLFKTINELILVLMIVVSHQKAQIMQSKFTKFVAVSSIVYAMWHLLRGFDNIVFELNLMDDIYTPASVLLTLCVVLAMLFHAISVTVKPYKEF